MDRGNKPRDDGGGGVRATPGPRAAYSSACVCGPGSRVSELTPSARDDSVWMGQRSLSRERR